MKTVDNNHKPLNENSFCSKMKLPIVIAEFIKYALLFLKNLVGFGLFGVLLFAWVFSYLLHALRLAFCL